MRRRVPGLLLAIASGVALMSAQDTGAARNAIIFVTDGSARSADNPIDTPALDRIRTEGVDFANTHTVFPSQTMPNAAAIATGHLPGDTGQFADRLFLGLPLFDSASPGRERGTMVSGLESASVLADVNDHFGGNVLREASLLAFARSYGYNTATIGRIGASALQDVSEVSPVRGILRDPVTIILDSATGTPDAVPLNAFDAEVGWPLGLATTAQSDRGACTMVRGCRNQGDPSGVREEHRAFRHGVLVSGPRGSKSRADPRVARCPSRRPRQDQYRGDGRSYTLRR
jgi:hypothetical protein